MNGRGPDPRTSEPEESGSASAVRIQLSGRVQGAGVRPAVARLASQLLLRGSVTNNSHGVLIHLEGSAVTISRFLELLDSVLPESADHRVQSIVPAPVHSFSEFVISCSLSESVIGVDVPVDLAICGNCLQELYEAADRRFQHAFNSCTQCGPRFSIIRAMPYERGDTSMADFAMCPSCAAEYQDSQDRRFHAQTIACPNCGPQFRFEKKDNRIRITGSDAIEASAVVVRQGGILALKGLGGYQLICDAVNEDAVQRLRRLKGRPLKPLAVMIPFNSSIESTISPALMRQEISSLNSSVNPIVVLQRSGRSQIARSVNRVTNTIGVLLPTTPLHALLLKTLHAPVVVTSGNHDSEPLAFQDVTAKTELHAMADGWLLHDRVIERPIDDSVVRIIAERPVTIRAARGISPLRLPIQTHESILAVGGEQKVAVALSNGQQAVLGPHIGDMNSVAARRRFIEQQQALRQLYGAEPRVIVHDLHPDYFTTRWASEQGQPTMAIQHHHAHAAAGMLEHNLLDQPVLAVVFDGTGYGSDGTIWGGEFLLASQTDFQRVASLLPFVLPGGEKSIHEPWRVAVALLIAAIPEMTTQRIADLLHSGATAGSHIHGSDAQDPDTIPSPSQIQEVQQLVHAGYSPKTSSLGRLFDGIAVLVLGTCRSGFEAETAMRLESACADHWNRRDTREFLSQPAEPRFHVEMSSGDPKCLLDWRPLVRRLVADLQSGCHPSVAAFQFHQAIAVAVGCVADQYAQYPIVLSGGCFQNRVLTEMVVDRLRRDSRIVAAPGMIPPNDGGLAVGQLVIAAARLRNNG